MESRLHRLVHELPKVDLHRHLEGSVRPGTLVEIAHENGISLPSYNSEELASIIAIKAPVSSLRDFLKPFLLIQRCLCSADAIRRVAYEVVEDAFKDNVRYLELMFGPAYTAGAHGLSLDEVFEGVISGIRLAERDFPIEVRLIAGPTQRWRERGWHSPIEVVEAAIDYKGKTVVGFGLASESKEGELLEKADPVEWELCKEVAAKAKNAGLFLTVHAGETSGAESVLNAIEGLGANRIGHGVNVIKNQEILGKVIEMKIPLEICLTSNVMSGAVSSITEHPFKRLHEMSAIVTLNTDDPSLCQITLTNEYLLAMKTFQLNLTDIKKVILNGISASFLSPREKEQTSKFYCL